LIEPDHPRLSIARQCELLSVNRSSYYYQPAGETALNLELMRLIDEQYLETPWYGARQMARHLRRQGQGVSRKRVGRLMRLLAIQLSMALVLLCPLKPGNHFLWFPTFPLEVDKAFWPASARYPDIEATTCANRVITRISQGVTVLQRLFFILWRSLEQKLYRVSSVPFLCGMPAPKGLFIFLNLLFDKLFFIHAPPQNG